MTDRKAREASGRTLITSDWHLGSFCPPGRGELALELLERARASGDRLILNGDIFESLFEPAADAEAAFPGIRDLIAEMTAWGQLLRTGGNHDLSAGVASLVIPHAVLGPVLVAHGHAADPRAEWSLQRVGDGISRRFGRFGVVRGSAHLVERIARAVAGRQIERVFRRRCRAMIEAAECRFGVFGHVHVAYLRAGDSYANSGHLSSQGLSYLVMTARDARLESLRPVDIGA